MIQNSSKSGPSELLCRGPDNVDGKAASGEWDIDSRAMCSRDLVTDHREEATALSVVAAHLARCPHVWPLRTSRNGREATKALKELAKALSRTSEVRIAALKTTRRADESSSESSPGSSMAIERTKS